ncbi:MAG TPA: dephospho-CoA kinase [Solirubrobacteraceae bacterium]|nr:dephospho-CoA kinase [Solirubrobacteraceae bacterium]
MPPFVGLTGGIGSGKSTALAALERLGCAVLSTDAVVHELYSSPAVIAAVGERFGSDVAPGGVVDRSLVAERAFATAEGREWLEQLLWPKVGQRMADWKAEAERAQPAPRAIVVEVPLLFESGLDHGYDATIAVVADEGLRAQRAGARGHRALDERAARQLTQAEKAARSTYVVVNDGEIAELEAKLSAVLDKMTSGANERDR